MTRWTHGSLVWFVALAFGASAMGQELVRGEEQAECWPVVGRVVDGSGQPLQGAEVVLGPDFVSTTGPDGRFELCVGSSEPVAIEIRLDGYASHEVVLQSGGDPETVALASEPPASFEDEVTVVARAETAIEPVRQIEAEDVVSLPGAGEDVLQALRAQPGVVSFDDWTSRLYVRGGRPDQNGIFLDGIPVYDPYRLWGFTSLFNADTVDSIAFYPGGFDVRYGDRLSSVIAVENRDGTLGRRFGGSANASLTNVNLVAEGRLLEDTPSSWMVSARRTYYDVLMKVMGETDSQYPSFTDAQARLLFQPSRNHRITVTLMGYGEATDLAEDVEPDFGGVDDRVEAVDDQKGFIAGLRGVHRLGQGLQLAYVLASTRNEQTSDIFFRQGETSYETSLAQDLTGDVVLLRSSLDYSRQDHTVQAGLEASQSSNGVTFRFRTQDPRILFPDSLLDFQETEDFTKVAAFLQDTWQITPALAIKGGVRWDRSTLSDMSTLSPRVSLRLQPRPDWELRAAWGQYTQFPSYESLQGDGFFLDLRGIKELQLSPERAVHWLVGASHTSQRGWRLGLDLYHKELDDLLQSGEEEETILVLDEHDQAVPYVRDVPTFVPENARSGYARGAEATFTLLERSDRPFYGMVSYSFSQAKTRDERGWLWELADQRHAVTAVGGWRFGKRWEVGLRWRFASGFAYTPLTNVIRVVEDLNGDGVFDPELGDGISHQRDEPYEVWRSARLPDYHRLDLRVQYSKAYSKLHAVFYLDIINAYVHENVIEYAYNHDYTQREPVTGMPFLPSSGVKITF